jgi:hypothetical protein
MVAASTVLAAVLLPVLMGLGTQRSSADDTAVHGLQEWAACVKGAGQGDLLVVMDASGSLETTDTDGKRIAATNFLLRQLRDVTTGYTGGAQGPGRALDLQVALSAFGETYRTVTDWQPLGPGGRLESEVQQRFPSLKTDRDTDYLTALTGARQTLTDQRRRREAAGATASCQALVWVSDGDYDLDPGDRAPKPYAPDVPLDTKAHTEQAVDRGYQALCRPGGVVDAVRDERINTLIIGLRANQTANFDRFQALAVGRGGPVTCGEVAPSGDFFLADQLEQLLQAVVNAFDTGEPPQRPRDCSVSDTACPGYSLVLDDSVQAFRALSVADREGLEVWVVPPGQVPTDPQAGTHLAYQPGTPGERRVEAADAEITYRWETTRALSIAVTRLPGTPSSTWTGRWWIRLVDPKNVQGGQSWLRLTVQGDKEPYPVDVPAGQLRADVKRLTFGVRTLDGSPVDVRHVPGRLELSVTLIDASGGSVSLVNGAQNEQIVTPAPVDLSKVAIGPGTLRLSLKARTADLRLPGEVVQGTWLDEEIVDVPVTVAPPPSYPRVETRRLDFGTLPEGGTVATGQLLVSGKGCVWVGASRTRALPEAVSMVRVAGSAASSQANCLEVDGTRVAVPVRFEADHKGDGPAFGSVTVSAVPEDDTGEPVGTSVEFGATMQTAFEAEPGLLALFLALALGLGAPVLAWLLLVWRAGRLPGVNMNISVAEVGDDTLGSELGGITTLVRGTRQKIGLTAGPAVDADLILMVKPGWLGGDGYVRPRVSGGEVATVEPGNAVKRGREVRLPRHLNGSWLAVEQPGGRYVVMLSEATSTDDERAELRARVIAGLEVLKTVSRNSASPRAHSSPDPDSGAWGPVPGKDPDPAGTRGPASRPAGAQPLRTSSTTGQPPSDPSGDPPSQGADPRGEGLWGPDPTAW